MKVVALSGGVGGAKLVDGLARILQPEDLTVIVNTGDDFSFLGLNICPDLDTVCYTLAGLANQETGWGRDNETWNFMNEIQLLGEPNWFRIGDHDLATHVERTRKSQLGESLVSITKGFCNSWGIKQTILPMSEDPIPTLVSLKNGKTLSFQEYFVKMKCEPEVKGFIYQNSKSSKPALGVIEGIREADLVVFSPSNPWVSIEPILSINSIREAINQKKIIAVSPIIQGNTLKGPAAKMFKELGIEPSVLAVAKYYQGLITGLVFNTTDEVYKDEIKACGIIPYITDTVMSDIAGRMRLASEVVKFGREII